MRPAIAVIAAAALVTFLSLSPPATFATMYSGGATLTHFHGPAMPGVDAGIQVTIGDLVTPSTGSAMITEAQESDLLAGLYYINYHTNACPGGEIRGQVSMTAASVGGIAELPDVAGGAAQTANTSGHDT